MPVSSRWILEKPLDRFYYYHRKLCFLFQDILYMYQAKGRGEGGGGGTGVELQYCHQ